MPTIEKLRQREKITVKGVLSGEPIRRTIKRFCFACPENFPDGEEIEVCLPLELRVFCVPAVSISSFSMLTIGQTFHLPIPLRHEDYFRGYADNEPPFPWAPKTRWSSEGYVLPTKGAAIPRRQNNALAIECTYVNTDFDHATCVEVEMDFLAVAPS